MRRSFDLAVVMLLSLAMPAATSNVQAQPNSLQSLCSRHDAAPVCPRLAAADVMQSSGEIRDVLRVQGAQQSFLLVLSREYTQAAPTDPDEEPLDAVILHSHLMTDTPTRTPHSLWQQQHVLKCPGLDYDADFYLQATTHVGDDAQGKPILILAWWQQCSGGIEPPVVTVQAVGQHQQISMQGEGRMRLPDGQVSGGQYQWLDAPANAPKFITEAMQRTWEQLPEMVLGTD